MEIHDAFNYLQDSIYTVVGKLKTQVWVTSEPVPFEKRFSGEHKVLKEGESWGTLFDSGWFHFSGTVPETTLPGSLVLLIDVNGELLLYDDKGMPLRGLTNKSCTYDDVLGTPVKRVFRLPDAVISGDPIDYWADAGCNDLFGELKENGSLKQAEIALCRYDIRKLYYDYEFLLNMIENISEKNSLYIKIKTALEEASVMLADFSEEALARAYEILAAVIYRKPFHDNFAISAIGHSHLDLAWLWPIRETRRKIARTLATVFELLERYPDYVYGISQPQLLLWVKNDFPILYKKLKEFYKKGRIELLGAMWVESDTNLPSGESLVRQLLYGKKFWKEEFDLDMQFLWLPDSFGFSGVLPQILRKSGVYSLITMKLSWNTVNKFPYHSFIWKGIDGSEILVHILPEGNYNSPANPGSVLRIKNEYHEKSISSNALMVYGIGDGGGGPGAEHLERLKRMNRVEGLPEVRQRKVCSFLKLLEKEMINFPTWEGELYLEKHQGTFTTESLSKYYNFRMENMLYRLEFLYVIAQVIPGKEWSDCVSETFWKETLLYQFHDILPGSSIKRVYDESWKRYREMLSSGEEKINLFLEEFLRKQLIFSGNQSTAPSGDIIFAFNFLSWPLSEWYHSDEGWMKIDVPSLGFTISEPEREKSVFPGLCYGEYFMENEFIKVEFNKDGTIFSVFDKEEKYEIIKKGERGNRIFIYNDNGDAWDYSDEFRQGKEIPVLVSSSFSVDGPAVCNFQEYTYKNSVIKQNIVIMTGLKRIDFKTEITWNEPNKTVRTLFPVNIPSGKAFCGTAFGAIQRPVNNNTSWDIAKDEIPAHGWIDISNNGYGVALISDSKYGYRVKGRVLDLCFLRSVVYPGSSLLNQGHTDTGIHNFTYSLYPHRGNYSQGRVVNTFFELAFPLKIIVGKNSSLNSAFSNSFFSIDDDSLIITSIKKAESGEGLVIRFFESAGKRTTASLHVHPSIITEYPNISAVNLMEEFEKEILLIDGEIKITADPYEISTLKLSR